MRLDDFLFSDKNDLIGGGSFYIDYCVIGCIIIQINYSRTYTMINYVIFKCITFSFKMCVYII